MTSFYQRSLISTSDLSKEEILQFLHQVKEGSFPSLSGKIIASCFFEPSTRTRLSFESAALRLGGNVIGFSDGKSSSLSKGETLYDTMKVIGNLADLIILRHPQEGAARLASLATSTPIINAGDGGNQHPTQTLQDLYTILNCQGTLEGLKIAFVGDLKQGRTVHSLALACALFNMRFYFVCPEVLSLPEEILERLRKLGIYFAFYPSIEEVLSKVDILYMTRIQKERLPQSVYEEVKDKYILKKEMLSLAKPTLKILHPLPRVNEIEPSIDHTPFAHYFEQAQNGLIVRQALLSLILNGSLLHA